MMDNVLGMAPGSAAASQGHPHFGQSVGRGLKRPRGSRTSPHLAEVESSDMMALPGQDDDEVVQPLSKRINRLNIDHAGRISPGDPALPVTTASSLTDSGPGQMGPTEAADPTGRSDFTHLYPYPTDSPYFQSNQLLRDLYLQREMRLQQLTEHQRHRLYGCSTPGAPPTGNPPPTFQHLQ